MKHVIIITRIEGEYDDSQTIIEDAYLIDTNKEEFDVFREYNTYCANLYSANGVKCEVDKDGGTFRFDIYDQKKREKYKGIIRETERLINQVGQKFKKELGITYFVEEVLKSEKIKFSEFTRF